MGGVGHLSTKVVSTQALIAKFEQALNEKWGYIWGTAGEKWTAAKQKELERTTDADRAQGRQYGSKWIGHTVADCSGLFSWAFKELGGSMYHGSDTMYRKYCAQKGELKKGKRTDSGTLKPGTAVFVWNGKKYSHVGLYAGGGIVIEAMGTINGVTTTKVSASKWTHWGELTGVDYSGTGSVDPVIPDLTPVFGGRSTLRKGSKGQTVTEMQTMLDKLGYDLGSYGVDGDFGRATEAVVRSFQSDHQLVVDGICGPATWTELEKSVDSLKSPVKEERYSVTISGLDLTQARALMNNYPGRSEIEREVG